MNQEISYINGVGESKLFTVSAYIKEFLGIIKIKNKKCRILSKWKTSIELVYDKLIMYLNGLHTSNSPRQIDLPKCTILEKYTIVLNEIFRIISGNHCLKMLYVKTFPQVFINQ